MISETLQAVSVVLIFKTENTQQNTVFSYMKHIDLSRSSVLENVTLPNPFPGISLTSKHNEFMETRGLVFKSNKWSRNCPYKLQHVVIRKSLMHMGLYLDVQPINRTGSMYLLI